MSLSLTPIVLALYVRLLAVTLASLSVAFRLMGPDHEGGVPPTHRHQKRVIVSPPDVGHVGAVCHVALELRVLALRLKRSFNDLSPLPSSNEKAHR